MRQIWSAKLVDQSSKLRRAKQARTPNRAAANSGPHHVGPRQRKNGREYKASIKSMRRQSENLLAIKEYYCSALAAQDDFVYFAQSPDPQQKIHVGAAARPLAWQSRSLGDAKDH
jgi:hypothetical protein